MSLRVSAEAPSNIAFIKYMGKTSHSDNLPSNPSLSWSIDHLKSRVAIESSDNETWEPLSAPGFTAPELNQQGQSRFLNHFQFLKSEWKIEGSYTVRSGNNFPSDCGVASSASSFAALTLATHELAKAKNPNFNPLNLSELSSLSRLGSGSSCRSLFSGWAQWEGHSAEEKAYPVNQLKHTLLILEESKKLVSSSEAHKRVTTSKKFEGRIERAKERLENLTSALNDQDWKSIYQITRDEFEDMHELFETSEPPFSYRTPTSRDVAQIVETFWEKHNDGPVITMDAGANVHLLWRADQKNLAKDFLKAFKCKMIHSPEWIEAGDFL